MFIGVRLIPDKGKFLDIGIEGKVVQGLEYRVDQVVQFCAGLFQGGSIDFSGTAGNDSIGIKINNHTQKHGYNQDDDIRSKPANQD
jgi:hypothetical protein